MFTEIGETYAFSLFVLFRDFFQFTSNKKKWDKETVQTLLDVRRPIYMVTGSKNHTGEIRWGAIKSWGCFSVTRGLHPVTIRVGSTTLNDFLLKLRFLFMCNYP